MKMMLLAVAGVLLPALADAGSLPLTLDAGYQAKLLFSVDASTGGFDYDSSGNIYYIGGTTADPNDTEVIKATAASGYATLVPIVNYNTSTYGSFVAITGSDVFYGDSIKDTQNGLPGYINESSTNVVTPTPAPNQLVSMPYNYDLAFSGTTPFVSANVNGGPQYNPENSVYELNRSTNAYTDILDTSDESGPIAFTSTGELIYGSTAYVSSGAIYLFSKADVDTAVSTGTPMTLSSATKVISDSGNATLALASDKELFSGFAPGTVDGTIDLFNLTSSQETAVGTLTNQFYFFSGMTYYDGGLTVAVTDGGSFTDFIEITAVPEPRTAALEVAGALVILLPLIRKRRRTASA